MKIGDKVQHANQWSTYAREGWNEGILESVEDEIYAHVKRDCDCHGGKFTCMISNLKIVDKLHYELLT